jgi:hypothetical protein
VRFVIPAVSTAVLGEFVGLRRQEKIEEKNVDAAGIAVNTPIIGQGLNQAMKIMGDGCSKEVNSYCEQVALGGGRVMNCLFDHESQLSSGCKQAISAGRIDHRGGTRQCQFLWRELRRGHAASLSRCRCGRGSAAGMPDGQYQQHGTALLRCHAQARVIP